VLYHRSRNGIVGAMRRFVPRAAARGLQVSLLLGLLVAGRLAAPAPVALATGLRGPQPFLIVLCRFLDVPDEPRSVDYFRGLFADSYPGLDAYWREASYGAISLAGTKVLDWQTLPEPVITYRPAFSDELDRDRLARDCIATVPPSIHPEAYQRFGLMFNVDVDRSRTGSVCLPGDRPERCPTVMWIGPNGYAAQATVAHEIGHAFGLKHSSVGDDTQYGNPWDVMSLEGPCGLDPDFGRLAQHPIAYDKDLLGWIPSGKKFVAVPGSQATIRLDRLSQPQGDGYLLAEIPIAGFSTHFYTVEARRRTGFDAYLPGDAVVIHEIHADQNPPARPVASNVATDDAMATGMWFPGDLFSDPMHGVAVSVDRETTEGYEVTIFTEALPWPVAPGQKAVLPAGNARFTWQPVAGATAYQLELAPTGANQASGGEQEVAGTSATMSLPPGDYQWRVRALPGGAWGPQFAVTLMNLPGAWRPADPVPGTIGALNDVPALTSDRDGHVTVVWAAHNLKNGGTALRAAERYGYGLWTSPGGIDDGQGLGRVRSPAVGSDATGRVYAAWVDGRQIPGGGPAGLYFSYQASFGGWYANQRIDDEQAMPARPVVQGPLVHENHIGVFPRDTSWDWGISVPALAVDRRGNSYAIWTDDRDVYFAFRPEAGQWGPGVKVNDAAGVPLTGSARLAVDLAGNSFAIWTDTRSGQADIYFAYRPASGGWGPNLKVSAAPSGGRASPAIAVDGLGQAYALWQDSQDCMHGKLDMRDVYFAVWSDDGVWSRPERVSTDGRVSDTGELALAVDLAGNAYAVWQEQLGRTYSLHSSYRPGAAPGAAVWVPLPLADAAASSDKELKPALAVDGRGNGHLAWVAENNGAEQVLLADAELPEEPHVIAGDKRGAIAAR
jgi:hypothetical protein